MEHCENLEVIKNCEIVTDNAGDFAIVTFERPLNQFLLAAEAQNTTIEDFDNDRVILQTQQYRIEMTDEGWPSQQQHPAKLFLFLSEIVPDLNDDVLRMIFSKLEQKTLANVAKCCQHFQTLAQNVFRCHFKHELLLRRSVHRSISDWHNIVDEFGAWTEKLDVCIIGELSSYAEEQINCRRIFEKVDPAHLKRACFNGLLTAAFISVLLTDFKCLPQLEELITIGCGILTTPINLHTFCPSLKIFKSRFNILIEADVSGLPSSLETLHIKENDVIEENDLKKLISTNAAITDLSICEVTYAFTFPNDFFDFLHQIDLHKNLIDLVFTECWEHSDLYEFNDIFHLTENLSSFEKLKSLRITLCANIANNFNASVIGALTKLETLEVCCNKVADTRPRVEVGFLAKIAARLPALNSLIIKGYEIESADWGYFQEALPKCRASHSVWCE